MRTQKKAGPPLYYPKSDTQINAFFAADLLVRAIILGDFRGKFSSIDDILEYGIDYEALDAYYEENEERFGIRYNTKNVISTYKHYLMDKLTDNRDAQYLADIFYIDEIEPNIPKVKRKKVVSKKKNTDPLPDLDDLL